MVRVHRTSFTQFYFEHNANSGLSRRYERSDFPGEPQYEDNVTYGGGFNVDTIFMKNQHSARGTVLCADTNNYMGHFLATKHVTTTTLINNDPEDVIIYRCKTPYLIKLFIRKKQEEYARRHMYEEPPPKYRYPRGNEM